MLFYVVSVLVGVGADAGTGADNVVGAVVDSVGTTVSP